MKSFETVTDHRVETRFSSTPSPLPSSGIFLAKFPLLAPGQWNFEREDLARLTSLITSTCCNESAWDEGRRMWRGRGGGALLMLCGRIFGFSGFRGFSCFSISWKDKCFEFFLFLFSFQARCGVEEKLCVEYSLYDFHFFFLKKFLKLI